MNIMKKLIWIKEDIFKEVKQLMEKYNLKFEEIPGFILNQYKGVIVGNVNDFNKFNMEFNNLKKD